MKLIICIAALALTVHTTFAQITIVQSDLPQAGQTFVMSNGNPMNISTNDLAATGPNQTWSFNLQAVSQQIDTMLSMSQVPFTYQAIFFQADYAQNNATPDFTIPIPNFSIAVSDVYDFFNRTNTKLEQMGFGANINGFPAPIPFSPRDVIYELPLTYNNTYSSNSAFTLPIPTLGSWSQQRQRASVVDGWGTLQGPLGNQDVLRVKSNVQYKDSIYVTALGFGFAIPREENEYRWVMKNGGVPILQVTTNVIFGNEVVSQVRYRDVPTGLVNALANNQGLVLYPQPASTTVIVVNPFAGADATLVISDMAGRVVRQESIGRNALVNVDVAELTDGIYVLGLKQGAAVFTRMLAVSK